MAPVDSPEVLSRFNAELELVHTLARQIVRELGEVIEFAEMLSFGREGLLEAARRFDPERGVSFRYFASFRIRGAILDGMRTHGTLTRRIYEKTRALRSATMVSEGWLEDTSAELASGLTADAADQRLSEYLSTLATAMAVGFGAQYAYDEQGETIPVADSPSPEAQVELAEVVRLVERQLDKLPPKAATLIRRHYFKGENIDQVSHELGWSKSWGGRMLTRGMEQLSRLIIEDHE